jgi:N-methylhydantoinase B
MPARIVETKPRPFKRVDVDPISLDIIENALRNARTEMDAVLFRTAMSPGIREQHDEFPMIANVDGKMVVGQFGSFIHGFIHATTARSRRATSSSPTTPTRAMARSATRTTG